MKRMRRRPRSRVIEPVAIVYRPSGKGWAATSPDLDDWRASGPSPDLLRARVEDEVRFAFDRDVRIAHLLPLRAHA